MEKAVSPRLSPSQTPNDGEALLGLHFERSLRGLLSCLDNPAGAATTLCYIDWHTLNGKVGLEAAALTLWKYVVPEMEMHGVQCGVVSGSSRGNEVKHEESTAQHGMVRVNCADSLDRTNLVSFLCVLKAIPHMVFAMHCVSAHLNPKEVDPKRWSSMLEETMPELLKSLPRVLIANYAAMFATGGDVCASLYCNSPAMHGGPIRDLADPKFVAKGWMTRNNAYISLQRRYQSAMKDERRTLKLELFLGRYWGYLFPRMGCRFLTASEVRRAVVVMDSLKAQEHIAEILLLAIDDVSLQREAVIAEAVTEVMSAFGEICEVFVNNYATPLSKAERRPLALLVYTEKEWNDIQGGGIQKCEWLEYGSCVTDLPLYRYMVRRTTPPLRTSSSPPPQPRLAKLFGRKGSTQGEPPQGATEVLAEAEPTEPKGTPQNFVKTLAAKTFEGIDKAKSITAELFSRSKLFGKRPKTTPKKDKE